MKTLIRLYFCLGLVLLLIWGCSEKWNGVDPNAVKVIAVDGAYPTSETIMKAVKGEKGAYPYFSNIYAAIRSDESDNSLSRQIYKWLSTHRAKDIIDESGYISIR